MFHKPAQGKKLCTNPDHRPMLPEFRVPSDPVDVAVRKIRHRFVELFPVEYRKWR